MAIKVCNSWFSSMLSEIEKAQGSTLLEVYITVYLEKRKRIVGWQTKQQLWRNPRKYILPVIVFIVVCGISMIIEMV